jgi:pimeloyl-ACP methyl ester carboxylesterase
MIRTETTTGPSAAATWAARFAAIFAFVSACVFAPPAPAQPIVQDIPTGGGSTPLLYTAPANPRAILFMFAGGDGTVAFNSANQITHMNTNFLMRTQNLWLAQGFGFATLGSSSSLFGERHTAEYAQTIGRAADFVRTRANMPVWLVGTSMGSIAAANGAAHLPGRVAGVVLTSSVAAPSRAARETVFDSDLGAIAVPALVVANRYDSCPSAGSAFAPQILVALARSPRKEIIYVESHESRSDPCEALSPHGYLGIETEVVQRIADWIRAAGGR